MQERYFKEFSVFKPDKKLVWMSHLGTLNLEIELDDRTIEAEVPPLEAAFIELFSEQGETFIYYTLLVLTGCCPDEWSVSDLITKVGSIERAAAIKALSTWIELGVLKEDTVDHYRLLKTAETVSRLTRGAGRQPAAAVEEELPPVLTVQQQQAEQMKVFWKVCLVPFYYLNGFDVVVLVQFIEGMLKNLGQLPLDRIQQMLKFAPGYDRSIEQLGAFMEAARREGLVTMQNGVWKLHRT
jgi:anaphase-promoting complex subunit 2